MAPAAGAALWELLATCRGCAGELTEVHSQCEKQRHSLKVILLQICSTVVIFVTICCFVVISHTTHLPDLSKTSRFWWNFQIQTLPCLLPHLLLLACFLDDTAAAAAAAGRLLHDLAGASAAAGWLHDVLA